MLLLFSGNKQQQVIALFSILNFPVKDILERFEPSRYHLDLAVWTPSLMGSVSVVLARDVNSENIWTLVLEAVQLYHQHATLLFPIFLYFSQTIFWHFVWKFALDCTVSCTARRTRVPKQRGALHAHPVSLLFPRLKNLWFGTPTHHVWHPDFSCSKAWGSTPTCLRPSA